MSNAELTLHGAPLSGHTHRVVLLLRMLKLPYRFVEADAPVCNTPELPANNPLDHVPVLQDGPLLLSDSNAILVYLARRYDAGGTWLPNDPVGEANVQRFLSLAAGELANGPATARAIALWCMPGDADRANAITTWLLHYLDTHLATHHFLAAERPTIADLACYSYVAHVPDARISLAPYKKVRGWLARIEALEGFVPMAPTNQIAA